MNLRSLLRRQTTEGLPQLPALEPGDPPGNAKIDERLERLLTPTELDMVLHEFSAPPPAGGAGPY
ncbi:hypothetical protein [Nocardia jinanensis]|uniref:Uncharacterized protein n=1 Tax=Nocardia jinanensis TaxID=382504 RepID=A0A917VXG2_9NOCA|nr:hypothetical protein [Nocardia jinanensis]GGL28517.1 hypothetical protein GCM10011588_49200 [Nocardia jinanensis]